MSDVKCVVFSVVELRDLNVVLYQDRGDHDLVFCPVAVDGRVVWEWKEVDKNSEMTPTFVIPYSTMRRFGVVQELVDGLYEATGIMTSGLDKVIEDSEHAKKHLEDLQRIIFESDFVNIQRGSPQVVIESEPETPEGS